MPSLPGARRAAILGIALSLLVAAPAGAACPGDCDDSGSVTINELVLGVRIALGQSPIDACAALDDNGDGSVPINELIAAVSALVAGCAGDATPSPTASGNLTPTPTPTLASNQPPVLPTASVYRSFPDFQITVPLNAADPEGGRVACTIDELPAGATFDAETGVLSWRPSEEQLGVFYLPYVCSDDASPPAAASGRLTFRITPLDDCTIPICDPATGCTFELVPVTQPCCDDGPKARIPEPVAGCPEGLVAHLGQNDEGFGRIQNCDVLHVRNFLQTGAEVRFNAEVRCLSSFNRIRGRARMDANAVDHPIIFDTFAPSYLFIAEPDGFARRKQYRLEVNGPGPFFDMQDAEANFTITFTDEHDVMVTERVRVRLSFTPQPDRPDLDPTPLATATRTPRP